MVTCSAAIRDFVYLTVEVVHSDGVEVEVVEYITTTCEYGDFNQRLSECESFLQLKAFRQCCNQALDLADLRPYSATVGEDN